MAVSLSLLNPEVHRRVTRLLAAARRAGLRVEVTSTVRTSAEQKRLYDAWIARGQTGLPAAPPGTSTHEYGIAVDLYVYPPGTPEQLGALAECQGLHWAGPTDRVHFDPFGNAAWKEWLSGQDVHAPPYRC
jgi:D-alanyl-D-alanine carboxypeptidase